MNPQKPNNTGLSTMTTQARRITETSRRFLTSGKWLSALLLAIALLFVFHGEARAQNDSPDGIAERTMSDDSGSEAEGSTPRGPLGFSRDEVADTLDGSVEGDEFEADDSGEIAEGDEDVVGEDGENQGRLVGKFMSFFRNSEDEEEEFDEATLEEERKVKELERFAVRNYERDRVSEAKKSLNDLITLKPYESYYHFSLGLCFRKEGRFQDSVKKYQDVLDLGGPKPLVHLLMAEAWAEDGDRDKVFEQLKLAAVGGRNIIHDVQTLTVLEQYASNTDFIKLALSLEKYEIRSKANRDPMTNPFPLRNPVDPDRFGKLDPEDAQPDRLTPKEQEELLVDARKAYDRVLWYIKLEDEEKAMENYTQLRKYMDQKELLTIPKIKRDFERLASRMETLEAQIEGIRLKFYYNQALSHLKKMKQTFYDAEYNKVELVLGDLQKVAEEMIQTNERYAPVAEKVLESGRVWIERTKVRQEFDANKPQIHGIIIAPETKLALVNGQIVNQGEHFGSFFVHKVENNRITFRYKGEEIPLVFRRY